jgi:hypothetical protein
MAKEAMAWSAPRTPIRNRAAVALFAFIATLLANAQGFADHGNRRLLEQNGQLEPIEKQRSSRSFRAESQRP